MTTAEIAVATTDVVWPEPLADSVIEDWFDAAIAESLVTPGRLNLKTTQEKAVELEKIGWLVLQVNNS